MTKILLVDNGSKRPESVTNLRRMADQLSSLVGQEVDAVPLQHADSIDAGSLGGLKAKTLPEYMEQQLQQGQRSFVLLPLFFGPSRALTSFVPATMQKLAETYPAFQWSLARPLFDEQEANSLLVKILQENVLSVDPESHHPVVLVDHGSPQPSVTRVRQRLAESLRQRLPTPVYEAVMERREGPEYDFNGPLLHDLLAELASEKATLTITLAMLFISPGRHAGPGGDISEICQQVMSQHPGLVVRITPLVGDHPGLNVLLSDRLRASVSGLS